MSKRKMSEREAAAAFTEKVLKQSWNLSSDDTPNDDSGADSDDEDDEALTRPSLGRVFLERHNNVLDPLIARIYDKKNPLTLSVAAPFLYDNDYVTTGKSAHEFTDMHIVPPHAVCALGPLEQILVAGFQLIYASGGMSTQPDSNPWITWVGKQSANITHMRMRWKFNGFPVRMTLQQEPGLHEVTVHLED